MPRPMGHIRILLSARVLLDLEEADRIFSEKGVKEYTDYMCGRGAYAQDYDPAIGGRRLAKGPLWSFAEAALKLNELDPANPVVEIGLYCKDDTQTALPIFRNLDVSNLPIEMREATNGHPLAQEDHETFETDLLLTRNKADAQNAVNWGIAAAVINFPPDGNCYAHNGDPIRLWVDGDAVAFGSSAEVVYRESATLADYKQHESEHFAEPVEPGPFTKVLAKISALNARFERGRQPFEISLLTARGGSAAARVSSIAQEHGIDFNGRLYFMGGAAKVNPLKVHKPDIFFDDQAVHLQEAKAHCATGQVAYPEGSPMHEYLRRQERAAQKAAVQQNAADITQPVETGPEKKPKQQRQDRAPKPHP